jgi:hypothetical protein
MDNIYIRVSNMNTSEMVGRVNAAVVYLTASGNDFDNESTIPMMNILGGAERADVYGRVCALIGYVTGEKYKTSNQKLVYEMVTGEKLEVEEPKKA